CRGRESRFPGSTRQLSESTGTTQWGCHRTRTTGRALHDCGSLMNEETEYSSWAALAAAYTAAAQKSPDTSIQDHLRFAQFDRFLTRIFAEKEHSEWLLKGGTGMLARVPNTRTTKDLDLVITDRD